jgi:hypothetical protein
VEEDGVEEKMEWRMKMKMRRRMRKKENRMEEEKEAQSAQAADSAKAKTTADRGGGMIGGGLRMRMTAALGRSGGCAASRVKPQPTIAPRRAGRGSGRDGRGMFQRDKTTAVSPLDSTFVPHTPAYLFHPIQPFLRSGSTR